MFQETADEGQGGAELDNSSVVVTLNSTTNTTTVLQQQQQPQPPATGSPPKASNNNPLSVKDLMLGLIERQLKLNPHGGPSDNGSGVPVSSGTPTISSILKTDHRSDINFTRDYKTANIAPPSSRDTGLATLSVVSGSDHGHHSAPSLQHMGESYVICLVSIYSLAVSLFFRI